MHKTLALTGHTSGIGRSIHDHFAERGFKVRGFSRSNGYDITDPGARSKLIQEIADFDVFVNNAHVQWAQTDLLYELFERWKNLDKLIINLGSKSSDGIKDFVHPYALSKKSLDEATLQLNQLKSRCRITTLKPSWVDTPAIRPYNVQDSKLDPLDVARMVEWVVGLPPSLHIESLTLKACGWHGATT